MDKEQELPAVEIIPLQIEGGISVEGHQAIWNPETKEIFAISSKKYKLIKHEDVLENIEEVLDRENSMGPYSRIISLDKKGGRMRATYRFSEAEVEIKDAARSTTDLVNPTIEVFNSYDLTWRHTVLLGAFRLICSNGLVVGETFMKFRKRHMQDLYLEDVKEALTVGVHQLEQQAISWEGWSEEKMELSVVDKTIEDLKLNKKETALLLEEPEVGTNLTIDEWKILLDFGESYKERVELFTKWTFFNILTQFITHKVSLLRRNELETRIRRAFY